MVHRTWQAESKIDQILLAASVAFVHGSYLWNRNVCFIYEAEKIIREIMKQCCWRFTGFSSCDYGGVIFDSAAISHFLHHLHVVGRACLKPFSLKHLSLGTQEFNLFFHFFLDFFTDTSHHFLWNDKVLRRVEIELIKFFYCIAVHHVETADSCHFVKIEFDSVGLVCFHVRREDFNDVTTDSESSSFKDHVVSLVLDCGKFQGKFVAVDFLTFRELDSHFLVKVRHAKTVYAADSRNDDYITAFHEGIGCGKAKFIDFLVY